MDIYLVQQDVHVFGQLVNSFPLGIAEAFNGLMKMLPDGSKRSYYGLSKMDASGHIRYWVATAEKYPGEAKEYDFEQFVIPAANYVSEVVHDWMQKTDCLKDVFHQLMQDQRADILKPCIEWYYSDDEMRCMLQLK